MESMLPTLASPMERLGFAVNLRTGPVQSKRSLLLAEVFRVNVVDWSPNGRYISFDKFPVNGGSTEDWVLPLSGDRKPFRAAPVSASQYDGHFSPDGRWLAYFSYETGRPEVYVVPFP